MPKAKAKPKKADKMEKMEEPMVPPAAPSKPAYGEKGGLGKWILIYVVIGLLIYGAVYALVLKKRTASDGGSGSIFSY